MSQSIFGPSDDTGTAELSALEPVDFERERDTWCRALEQEALRLRRSPNFNPADADVRFSTSLPRSAVESLSVAIVGAGGIGNWQWRVILGMGFQCVALYDDDVVNIENVGPQAHNITDIGLPKVEAVRRAALAYRAGNILARKRRVQTLGDIADDLGFMPDIVIGCTDSAEFRNGFIADLHSRSDKVLNTARGLAPGQRWTVAEADLPWLFLDFRMALGDWHCFAIPCRYMALAKDMQPATSASLWRRYEERAVFAPEDAVREPCTERAITYTGANTASYTGAFLHWWLTKGITHLNNSQGMKVFFDFQSRGAVVPELDDVAFRWLMTYSSRDWEQGTPTWKEKTLRSNWKTERKLWEKKHEDMVFLLEILVGKEAGRSVHLVDASDWQPGDYVYTPGLLLRCVDPAVMDAAPDTAGIPLRETSGRRRFMDLERIAAVFRPRTSLPEDVRYTAIPGVTWIQGTINKEGGHLHLVGKVESEGDALFVCGHDVWSVDEVGPCRPPEPGEAYAASFDPAVGDVVKLPVTGSYAWRVTARHADRFEAQSLRPGGEDDRLIASCKANIVLLKRAGEEQSRSQTAA